ncbi:MAG TPA: SCO family protein, partial [Desulfuromonadaceae bacterium]
MMKLVLAAWCLAMALLPRHAGGHSEAELQEAPNASVGVDEHLGAKIPLDTVFRDEAGRPVRLADLVTGPTIILPVYYSCTNVCSYLQSGLARVLPAINQRPGTD